MKPKWWIGFPGYSHFFFEVNCVIIHFISALLISAAVYMLGNYAILISLTITAIKVLVGLIVLVLVKLRHTMGIKFIGR